MAHADELWEAPRELDLVVVATPNRAHVPQARAALAAGLPVVVDKPLAATAREGRELADEAARLGLMLTVFQNRRWDGDYLTLRRLLAEGALGRAIRLESRFDRWRPRVAAGAWREGADPRDAGGLLADLGQPPDRPGHAALRPAGARLRRARPAAGGRAGGRRRLRGAHARGGASAATCGRACWAPPDAPRFRAVGLEGTYESYGLDGQEAALAAGVRPGGPEWGRAPEESWGRLWDGEGSRAVPTEPGDYPAFYAGVARSLRDGAPPPVDPRDSVAVLEVIEAARQDAARSPR